MTYIYTGPSWAASSYPIGSMSTNLAREWNFQFIDLSRPGSSILDRVEHLKKLQLKHPVVWIYNEPFRNLTEITNMPMHEVLQRSDWEEIWLECNEKCLSEISKLNLPVLLIGGHSDIVNCKHSNITVACDSWQKWLAKQAGMPVTDGQVLIKMDDGGDFKINRCWGAEVIHKFIYENSKIDPDPGLMNSVWDIFFFWKELEKSDLFYEVHPSLKGNQQFAEFLFPVVAKFIQENQ